VLQALASAAARGQTSLLIAAEESGEQVRRRAERLEAAVDGCYLLATSDLDVVISAAGQLEPSILVVDSIQAVSDPSCGSQAGSPSQVRECAGRLVRYAKSLGVATLLVGHVTKDGGLAGPRTLEHLVDTVLSFDGDRHHALRMLSVSKHRYGPTGELGLFEMTEAGLDGLVDPSALLLGDRRRGVPGSIAVPVLEGRRPLIVEVQGLVGVASSGVPRRVAQGIAGGRLALLLAVLERRCQLALGGSDVFVSTVGGLRVNEPAADLGIALALVSALTGISAGEDIVACGEIGLAGEIRQVPATERRLGEAARLGFRRAVVPQSAPDGPVELELLRAGTLLEAVRLLFGVVPAAGSHRGSSLAVVPS
jgi:DNA repair protein RadA/Sms